MASTVGHQTVKSCGNDHPYCGDCRPDVAVKTRAALLDAREMPEALAKSAAAMRTPLNRAVASANTRRYYDNDYATGGARVPGGLRDAHIRARAAYVAEQEG